MGRRTDEAHCAVRFSSTHDTTADDVEVSVQALERGLEEMETTVEEQFYEPKRWFVDSLERVDKVT